MRLGLPERVSSADQTPSWVWLALIVAACVLPFVMSDFRLLQATMTLIFAVLLFGLNVLTGFSGQISLGHSAFYAMGAYISGLLILHMDVPYWMTLPISAAVCWVAGFLFGRPALRLEGHYLALATFALAVAVPQFLKYKPIQGYTGGVRGIMLHKPIVPFGLPVSLDAWLYWFTLAVTAIMFVAGRNMLRGRVRRALLAIRDQPTAAAAMGINLAQYKSFAFAISALYAGVAGSLSAIVVQYVAPDSFQPLLSIMFLVGLVIGGLTSSWGPLFGAIFLQFVPNVVDEISKSASGAFYGVVVIVCIFLMRRGITGAIVDVWAYLRPASAAREHG